MSSEMRGSDKLKQTCSSLTELSPEEMEQISGGYFSSSYKLVAFPHGIPWPEFFRINTLDQRVMDASRISNGF